MPYYGVPPTIQVRRAAPQPPRRAPRPNRNLAGTLPNAPARDQYAPPLSRFRDTIPQGQIVRPPIYSFMPGGRRPGGRRGVPALPAADRGVRRQNVQQQLGEGYLQGQVPHRTAPARPDGADATNLWLAAGRQGEQAIVDYLAYTHPGHINQVGHRSWWGGGGKTPLAIAASKDLSQNVLALLRNGADPIGRSDDMRTPLHEAIRNGSPGILEELLKRGIAGNIQRVKRRPHLADKKLEPGALVDNLFTYAVRKRRPNCFLTILAGGTNFSEAELLDAAQWANKKGPQYQPTYDAVMEMIQIFHDA